MRNKKIPKPSEHLKK